MSPKAFGYEPLDSKTREIRVLTLLPGAFEEPIQVSISKQSLNANHLYNALSYVWGDPNSARNPGNIIQIDGHDFPVTTNLLTALRHLRLYAGATPITLWIDAVCINQTDVDERTQQVSMMRDIYASADRVFIWLGEGDDESDAVFDTLPMLATRKHRQDDEQDKALVDAVRKCSGFLSGLMSQRPWFTRVWIIQELAMAKNDPQVMCGRKSVTWSVLMKASEFVSRKIFTEIGLVKRKQQGKDGQNTSGNDPMGDIDDLREDENDVEVTGGWKIDVLDNVYKAMKSQGGERLTKLLMISRSSEATDPRDRIYALLGLLKPELSDPQGSGEPVVVDYRKPAAAVYADAVAHIFAQGEGPYFLSGVVLPGISAPAPHIPSLPSTTPQPPFPSWVPDFSRQVSEKTTQPGGTLFHPPAGISASGPGAGADNGRRLEDKKTLRVEGLFVDTIEDVIFLGESLKSYLSQLTHIESLAKTARQRHCQLEPSIRPYVERYKDEEPLWKALISNKRLLSGYDPAPESYEAMYRDLLNNLAKGDDWEPTITYDEQDDYIRQIQSHAGHQSFFTTKSGFVGTCVPNSRKGDIIAILFGSPVPFVLRPAPGTIRVAGEEKPTHYLIGVSYVSGIMAGEMVDELYCEDLMDSTTYFIQ
ncbi:HET-domain-containing protein [Hypomontagnella monticulosa]|nr:HET-domain-containing protein [Hypomontagnella monticulosa]